MMNVNMQDLKYQAVGLPDEVRMYHYAGDFAGELSCIDRWLARQVPDCLRKRLELQKLFAAQLLDDYPLGDDDMVAGLKERRSVHAGSPDRQRKCGLHSSLRQALLPAAGAFQYAHDPRRFPDVAG